MSIITRVPWTVQPQSPVGIAAEHSRGMELCFDFVSMRDSLGKSVTVDSGTYTPVIEKAGRGIYISNNIPVISYPNSFGAKTSLVISAVVTRTLGSNPVFPLICWNANFQFYYVLGAAGAIEFGVYNGGNALIRKTATGVISTGVTYHIVVAWQNSQLYCYVNGSSVPIDIDIWVSGTVTALPTLSDLVYVGYKSPDYNVGNVFHVAAWTTPKNLEQLSQNPWQIFAPQTRRIWAPSAGAPSGFQAAWARNRSYVIGAGAR